MGTTSVHAWRAARRQARTAAQKRNGSTGRMMRKYGSGSFHLLDPAQLGRPDTTDEIFFHIVGARRNGHGKETRALAGCDRAIVGSEPERTRTLTCRAVEELSRHDGRRQ